MTVYYEITERKPFVKALEEITGEKAKYQGTPSYAYEVGCFTISREGNLIFNDMADPDEMDRVLDALEQKGYHADRSEYDSPQPEINQDEPLEDCPPAYGELETEDLSLTVEMPREQFTDSQLENLQKLVTAKAPLLKEALAVKELPIIVTDEKVSFPWFKDDLDADACAAYTCLITAICRMAKEAKRVTAKEKEVDNVKYAFRCFLLRLGFIGDEYKQNRKILMRNLTGSSAFKNGTKKGGEQ